MGDAFRGSGPLLQSPSSPPPAPPSAGQAALTSAPLQPPRPLPAAPAPCSPPSARVLLSRKVFPPVSTSSQAAQPSELPPGSLPAEGVSQPGAVALGAGNSSLWGVPCALWGLSNIHWRPKHPPLSCDTEGSLQTLPNDPGRQSHSQMTITDL